ncbi:MAG TPA: MarR family winged helix-turn-helix transcriptional regulator [Pirellulales bacterium]|nr:MarR family winged helix-turn-helix transcriptional regulator [Pirellulales bacterium]
MKQIAPIAALPQNGLNAGHRPSDHFVEPLAQDVTNLLMSLMRDLFAVDDQASDLPLRQLRVCALLYEGSRSMTSLSRELGVSLPAMTQIADRLERARLVKRAFEGSDRRVRSLQLTPRAQRIMRLRENCRIQRASDALQQLPPQDRTNVLTTLKVLLNACSAAKTINHDASGNGANHHANGKRANGKRASTSEGGGSK